MEGNLLRFSSIKGNLSIAGKNLSLPGVGNILLHCLWSALLFLCSCVHCVYTCVCSYCVFRYACSDGTASLRIALIIKTQPASLLLTEVWMCRMCQRGFSPQSINTTSVHCFVQGRHPADRLPLSRHLVCSCLSTLYMQFWCFEFINLLEFWLEVVNSTNTVKRFKHKDLQISAL